MARSSTFHSVMFEMKTIEPAQLNETRGILESTFEHLHIRHSLHPEKAEDFLSNEKLLLIGNEGRAEPGFLCFLPKKPVQFVKCRLDQGNYLRLRVDSSVFNKGTVFIATVDQGVITLQDCWMWRGDVLVKEPFSKRLQPIHSFLQNFLIQDSRLSGFELKLATFRPLSEFSQLVDSGDYQSIEFLPENPRRRRHFYRIEQPKVSTAPLPRPAPTRQQQTLVSSVKKHPRPQQQQQQQRLPPGSIPTTLVAIAKNIQGLPDTFDLFSYDKKHIGEAAVQEEETSFALRNEFKTKSSLVVLIEWNSFLDSYEIKKLAPQGSRIHTANFFIHAAQQTPGIVEEEQRESPEPVDIDI